MGRSRTLQNLTNAFVGEAKASVRLLGYAEVADKEGFGQIARLFRAISTAEKVHALKHLRLLKVIGSTEENLQAALEAEASISENTYPAFIQTAEEDAFPAAQTSFSHARDAEACHARLYKHAMEHMLAQEETSYFICPVSGYVADGEPPERCPICGARGEKFIRVD
jgi:rubrerythrin